VWHRSGSIWDDNIKMDIRDIGWGNVDGSEWSASCPGRSIPGNKNSLLYTLLSSASQEGPYLYICALMEKWT